MSAAGTCRIGRRLPAEISDDIKIGARVRAARILRGISLAQLGRMAGDITFQQMQKYENATNRISVSRLIEIAHALRQPISFFFEDISGLPAMGSPELDQLLELWASFEPLPAETRIVAIRVIKELGRDETGVHAGVGTRRRIRRRAAE